MLFRSVMGILNITPDSFADGGKYFSKDAAINHGRRLITEGAREAKSQGRENIIKDAELAKEIERFCKQMTLWAALIKGGNPSQFGQHQQVDK